MSKNIDLVLKTFRELQNKDMIQDKETEQIKKISDMLGVLQNKEKYRADILKFDEIFDEVVALSYILSEKYIKIGVSLERASGGFFEGDNDE